MALLSDSDGFLRGQRADIDPAAFARHLEILRVMRSDISGMRSDIAAIRKAITKPSRARLPANAANASAFRSVAATASSNATASGRLNGRTARINGTPNKPEKVRPIDGANSPKNAIATSAAHHNAVISGGITTEVARPRKANGQFGSGGKKTSDSGEDESRKNRESTRKLAEAADGLKRGAGEALGEVSQVDPAIAAAKEMKEIASPLMTMFKPLGGLFKRGSYSEEEKVHKKTVPWYKRIWGELRGLNKKSGGGGSLSGLGGLLMKLPGIGMLVNLVPMLLSRLGGVLLRGLGGVGPMLIRGLGALMRSGLVGALTKLSLPVAGILTAVTGFKTSTEEYAKRMGVELNGSLAQELGVRFVGVLGDLGNTISFGAAGKLGELLSPAISDAFTAIAATWDSAATAITGAWTSSADWVKGVWSDAVSGVSSAWDKTTSKANEVFDAVGNWLNQKLGIVKEVAATVYDRGAAAVGAGANAAQNALNTVTGGAYNGGSNANKAAAVEAMNGAGIKDPKEQAMFMAQLDHESGGFQNYEENLKYSAAGLRTTFGRYYTTDAEAQADARNPEAIANKVYGGRMGNVNPGDGYKFRGRGAIQLTGRSNYEAAGSALGIDLANNPDLAKDPATAAKIAAWYWKKNNVGAAGKAGDVTTATRKINGGTNGLADRQQKYASYLKEAEGGGLTMQTANASTAVPPVAVTASIASAVSAPRVPAMLAPVGVSTPVARYSPAGQDVARYTPGATPAIKEPIGSIGKDRPSMLRVDMPLTQDVSDRNIAAVATGGIGMGAIR